jgi:hypothetical protein
MQPLRKTNPDLLSIQQELSAREPIFHRLELGTSREALLEMTTDDFWEVGASGKQYSREFVINFLQERYAKSEPELWSTQDFYCQEIAEDNYLLTYTLCLNSIHTQRATLWRRTGDGWKIIYHQGTIIPAS